MGINAFTQGLKSVNKDATVSVIWAMTWYDPGKEADAAKVHIAEGADVLAQHTDTPAMLQTAEEKGAYGFGQGSDMESFAPKAQLFASVNHWDISYIEHIEAALEELGCKSCRRKLGYLVQYERQLFICNRIKEYAC